MKVAEAIAWFDQIAQQHPAKLELPQHDDQEQGKPYIDRPNRPVRRKREETLWYVQDEATRWITDADSALKSVFPPTHAVVKQWDAILAKSDSPGARRVITTFDTIRAVFESARAQLKEGRVARLIDTIRAESVEELLEQADTLLTGGYLAAATVIAGGALESFLRHLCERNTLALPSGATIAVYDGVLARARNAGNEIISATESKMVTSWGAMRNDAAHRPGQANLARDDVRRMIEGIREFAARHR